MNNPRKIMSAIVYGIQSFILIFGYLILIPYLNGRYPADIIRDICVAGVCLLIGISMVKELVKSEEPPSMLILLALAATTFLFGLFKIICLIGETVK